MAPARHAAFAEESAEVEVLYANLEKMKSLSRKIQGSMARLDVSGKVVQDAIGPIYGNTQRLQTTTNNVDRITEAIEKARQPLDMRNREEQVLRERPERVGLGSTSRAWTGRIGHSRTSRLRTCGVIKRRRQI